MMDANAIRKFAHHSPPTVKERAQRSVTAEAAHRIGRIRRKLAYHPLHALRLMAAVALGVGLAIAIIAASEGINSKINVLLHSNDVNSQQELQRFGIDLPSIQSILIDTRNLLTSLAIAYTTMTVALVTWISLGQQRREIAQDIQEGQYMSTVVGEIVAESAFLCFMGGLLGIGFGLGLCHVISQRIPLLPMAPSSGGIFSIFPVTVVITFMTTALIAMVFAHVRDSGLEV